MCIIYRGEGGAEGKIQSLLKVLIRGEYLVDPMYIQAYIYLVWSWVFGGLVIPVCSYILSESLLHQSTAVEVGLCPVIYMYCVGELNPLLTELPAW